MSILAEGTAQRAQALAQDRALQAKYGHFNVSRRHGQLCLDLLREILSLRDAIRKLAH